jgi:kynurenine formamidase
MYTINQSLKKFFNFARLISVYPKKEPGGDRVIERRQLEEHISEGEVDALLIRTLPNDSSKLIRNYSGTNPPFLSEEAASWLNETGIRHLLLDLPSVDREEDDGALAAHKAFWGYPEHVREDCTITELIYVPEHVPDGLYLLNIQIAGFEIDVSPSKPILYAIKEL